MKKILFSLGFLFVNYAYAVDVKISALPLGSASTSASLDSFPYVSSGTNVTKRLTLWDLSNIPTIVSTFAPKANPVFTGTVTAPTFSGNLAASFITGTVSISHGGTGQTSANPAFNALSPLTTLGDVLYGGSSGAGTRLAGPTSATKQFFTSTGTGSAAQAPAWASILSADLPTITLTGDVTGAASGGSVTTAIGSNKVANSQLAQMASHTYKGNNTGSTANALDLTATQMTAELNLFSSTLKGLAPLSGGGTTNFLRADGTWAAPPASTAKIAVGVAMATGINIPNASSTATVIYDTVTVDQTSSGAYNTSTGVFTASKAMNLLVGGYVDLVSGSINGGTTGILRVYKNGTLQQVIARDPGATGQTLLCMSGTMILPVSTSDTVEIRVFQTTGVTQLTGSGGETNGFFIEQ